jgi:hypothetical protein
VPVTDINGLSILDRDEHLRPDTDMQALAQLAPAFSEMGEDMPGFDKVALMKYPHLERIAHIHHAGNSSGHRRRCRGGAAGQPGVRRAPRADAAGAHPWPARAWAPSRRSCSPAPCR